MSEAAIRVAIVEDKDTTRDGLALLIDGTPGFRCVGSYRSVEEALRGLRALVRANLPQVMLLDIHLPGMTGSDGIPLLQEAAPGVQIVMLTVYAEEDKVFESICNGACGYLLKKTPPEKLLEGIREALDGGSPMTPEIARKVVRLFQRTGPPAKLDHHLTPQEVRLLRLLSEGHSYQAIGDQVHISINTVRDYIRSIYEKLHVHSKSEAVAKAFKSRLF